MPPQGLLYLQQKVRLWELQLLQELQLHSSRQEQEPLFEEALMLHPLEVVPSP